MLQIPQARLHTKFCPETPGGDKGHRDQTHCYWTDQHATTLQAMPYPQIKEELFSFNNLNESRPAFAREEAQLLPTSPPARRAGRPIARKPRPRCPRARHPPPQARPRAPRYLSAGRRTWRGPGRGGGRGGTAAGRARLPSFSNRPGLPGPQRPPR